MNWSIKKVARVLLAVTVLSGGMLSWASEVRAQEKGSTLAQQVQGNWILVSLYNEQNGMKTELFGPQPRGFLMMTPDGRISIILMRASLPKFAANNRMKGTPEENQAVVQGSLAEYGTYAVASEKEHLVIWHLEACTFPNWEGTDQKRIMDVSGDELKITVPAGSTGGSNYLVFKRAK
ncbi:MAG: lipocalin-like domain-containing protein [Desulfobaccales bacterium]